MMCIKVYVCIWPGVMDSDRRSQKKFLKFSKEKKFIMATPPKPFDGIP